MKRAIILLMLLLLIAGKAYSSSGYKDFKWGQTVGEIKARVRDLKKDELNRFAAPNSAMLFLYGDKYNEEVPNPLTLEKRPIDSYGSESQSTTFWFVGNRLAGVEIAFDNADIFNDLVKKYGHVNTQNASYYSYEFETATWDKGDKLIVWEKANGQSELETVTYVDGVWIKKLFKILLDKRNKEMQEQENKLE